MASQSHFAARTAGMLPGAGLPPRPPTSSGTAASLTRRADTTMAGMMAEVTFAAESSSSDDEKTGQKPRYAPSAGRISSAGSTGRRSAAEAAMLPSPSSAARGYGGSSPALGAVRTPTLRPASIASSFAGTEASPPDFGSFGSSFGSGVVVVPDEDDEAVRNFGLPAALVALTGGVQASSTHSAALSHGRSSGSVTGAASMPTQSPIPPGPPAAHGTPAALVESWAKVNPAAAAILASADPHVPAPGGAGTASRSTDIRPAKGSARPPSPMMSALAAPDPHMASLRSFLVRPLLPGEGMVRCCITRDRGTLGLSSSTPHWRVYSETDNRFLMGSKKRTGSRTSNYLIVMDHAAAAVDRRSRDKIAGKVRADWAGSQYTLFDHGLSPSKVVTGEAARKEMAVAFFNYDVMGPGQMRVAIPRVDPSGHAIEFKAADSSDTISAAAAGGDRLRLMWLANKKPKIDPVSGGPVLNFGGRVSKASVKNFQLSCEETGDAVVLQFGRNAKDRFAFDVAYPLSILQGFAIVLAALDPKIADTRGYEAMRAQRKDQAHGDVSTVSKISEEDDAAEEGDAVAAVFGAAAVRRPASSGGSSTGGIASAFSGMFSGHSRRASAASTGSMTGGK